MNLLQQNYGNIDESKGIEVKTTGTVLDEIVQEKRKSIPKKKFQEFFDEVFSLPKPPSFKQALLGFPSCSQGCNSQ